MRQEHQYRPVEELSRAEERWLKEQFAPLGTVAPSPGLRAANRHRVAEALGAHERGGRLTRLWSTRIMVPAPALAVAALVLVALLGWLAAGPGGGSAPGGLAGISAPGGSVEAKDVRAGFTYAETSIYLTGLGVVYHSQGWQLEEDARP